jgi:putative FmdB family regulatory protein
MICAHLMPIYDYKCDNGHRFEAMQSMSDAPIDTCDVCDAPAHRILHAPAVHFKGSGFYTTDYARKKAKAASGSESAQGDGKGSKDGKGGESSSGDSSPSKADSGSSSSSGGEKTKAKQD